MGKERKVVQLTVQENAKLSEVLDQLFERAADCRIKDCCGFRPFSKSPARTHSAFSASADSKELLHYKAMISANMFDMNTEVRNLPVSDLEVVSSAGEATRRGSSELRIKSDAVPLPLSPAEDAKAEGEEAKKCYTENRSRDYGYEVNTAAQTRNLQ